MNFVYGIICHKLSNPLIFLVNELLKSSSSIIVIHVDRKSDISLIQDGLPQNQNLHFIQDRVNVIWGAYSQIEATIKLLKYSRTFQYKYFHLLSGDDIPLKKINIIEKYLCDKEIQYLGHDKYADPIPRVKYQHPKFFYGKQKTILKKIFVKIFRIFHRFGVLNQSLKSLPKLYKGTSWFTLTQSAINYILEYIEKNPNYDLAFRRSYCGDEVYFHTIIYNSPFKKQLNLNYEVSPPAMALRYIDWKSGPDFPRTLDNTDFKKMKESNLLFARKLNPNILVSELDVFHSKKEP